MLIRPTAKEILEKYPKLLKDTFGPAQRDVEDLLADVLKMDRANLFAHLDQKLTPAQLAKFKVYFHRRKKEIPLQYIFGRAEFHGLEFMVNKFVLIPRPETELLVDKAKEFIEANPIRNVVDIGTGSGAIIITLAKLLAPNKKEYNYIGTDKSPKALALARLNGLKYKVIINFRQRDFIKKPNTFLPLTSWVLVSNPPYVKSSDLIEPSIQHEPKLALDGGDDGLEAYRILLKQVSLLQNKPKAIFFEIGYDQAEAIKKIVQENIQFKTYEVFQDFCGKDRVVKIVL